MPEHIHTHQHNGLYTITLSRPEKRNALSPQLVYELQQALECARSTDSIRVVLLAAEGKAFCAGADLLYLQTLNENSPLENLHDSAALMEMFYALRTFPKPTVAKVQGPALAGGCGLALCCDIIVASKLASFGFTEVRIGFVPAIVMKLLVERIGTGASKEYLLRGNIFSAEEAFNKGLCNHLAEPDQLDALVEGITSEIIEKTSPQAVRLTKELLMEIEGLSLRDAMKRGAAMNGLSRTTDDFKKGVSSFINKEPLSWD